jgi:outer membrane lipoprotein SlyB
MHESEHAEFTEKIHRPLLRSTAVRGGMILGSALLFAVGVASVMGASASPSTGADPSASAAPSTAPSTAPSIAPGTTTPANPAAPDQGDPNGPDGAPGMGPRGFGFGFGGRGFGVGFGDITITAINGNEISLKTDDGWTRTVTVTSDTTITRAGTTIAIGDLKVGDQVVFRQERQADGTYTITEVRLVLPTVAGKITKIDGSTITVQRFDGTTQVIHVDSSTTYRIAGSDNATLKDLAVDDVIVAQGTQQSDGSLDAEAVAGGSFQGFGHDGTGRFGFPGMPGGPDGNGPGDAAPGASPAPSANAG